MNRVPAAGSRLSPDLKAFTRQSRYRENRPTARPPKAGIDAAPRKQVLVTTLLRNASIVENDNPPVVFQRRN
ncbi:hypothetical protein AJ87_12580 [Rhizobium yanglingense]|nr:hypothetical protein AJ87_12580 [Rhizobium yanglingense]